jgi:signal transduction histidine kinase/ActR/RegA family two-component response regulator
MASETPNEGRLAGAVRARRRNLMPRVTAAALLALMASRLIGWDAVVPWIAAYTTVLLVEVLTWAPITSGRTETLPGWRSALGCLAVLLDAAAFGAISIPLWKIGGAIGGVCACFVLMAAIINAVVNSPRSRTVLAASIGPQAVYIAAFVAYAPKLGASSDFVTAAALGAVVFCTYSLLLWRSLEKTREAEAFAHLEAEQRREELEAAVAAKSRFTSVISHELRAPLTALMTSAEQLKVKLADTDLRGEAALVEDAGQLMRSLLDNIVDGARLQAQAVTVEQAPFSLRDLVAQTLRMWRPQADAKGLKLGVEGLDQAPDWLSGDAVRIRQILNNLMSNAVKFTAEGSIVLQVSAWPADEEGCSLLLRVADTGAGMDKDQLARLFMPFDQLDPGAARDFVASGLGLLISRQLARLMGGELTARSEPGRGAVFTVALTLPVLDIEPSETSAELEGELAPAPAAAAEPAAAPEPEVAAAADAAAADEAGDEEDRPLKALVVDDHEINRRAVELVLAPLGAEITTAVNGKLALEAALHQAFDVIIMDVRMPEMNGREATRKIRTLPGPNQATPVIAVTADSDTRDVQACLDAGMDWFIAKPIDPAKLVQTVIDALQGAQAEADAGAREVA